MKSRVPVSKLPRVLVRSCSEFVDAKAHARTACLLRVYLNGASA
jgi:hypothetical protein